MNDTGGISRADAGTLENGEAVSLYTLENGRGMTCRVLTYGGIIKECHVPDRAGASGDVVLGYDHVRQYEAGTAFFGALVGRVANRIARGKFELGGRQYSVATNDGSHALHGGRRGFDKAVWQASPAGNSEGPGLRLRHQSPDGDEGFPGNVDVVVTYMMTADNTLRIIYEARTDHDTPLNLTNHSYFNLSGRGLILDHELQLNAELYTPVDDTLIPTGEIAPVRGTPMDFTAAKRIGRDLGELTNQPQGYDHNFVLAAPQAGQAVRWAAQVFDPVSGRRLEVWTDQPGVQFYSGNFLDGKSAGKNGQRYPQYSGFCLETQHFPDAVNQPQFPSIILRAGATFRSMTEFRFSA